MAWSKQFEVDLPDIDAQHQHFWALVEHLDDPAAVESDLEGLFDELARYARYHFKSEEALMDAYEFPGAEDHKREHANLVTTLLDIRAPVTNKAVKPERLQNFLREWFEKHCLGTDRLLAEHVRCVRASALRATPRRAPT